MTSVTQYSSSVGSYEARIKELEKRLDEFELGMKLIQFADPYDIQGAKALMPSASLGLSLNSILTTYAFRTSYFQRDYLLKGTNPYSELFVEIWLLYDSTFCKLTIELTEDESLDPKLLIKKFEENTLYLSKNSLKKIVNRADPVFLEKLSLRLSTTDKVIVLDQMEERPSDFIRKEEVVDAIDALEMIKSNKTVTFISSLPLDSFLELSKIRVPLCRILSRCYFIPDLLELKKMGETREKFLLHSIPYDENRQPFVKVLYKSLDKSYVKSFPPILLILCLKQGIPLDPILPFLSKSRTDIYAQIPFIAVFGNHTQVLSLFRYFKKHEDPTCVYTLLKSLDIKRREDDDCLSLEDVSILINKKVKKCFDELSYYLSLFKKRRLTALWSPEEIESLECFQDLLRWTHSLQYDALIAPFYQFRAKALLTNDIAKVKRLSDEGIKLLPSLMQYEDKKAKGVISKGRTGNSHNRVPVIWKSKH